MKKSCSPSPTLWLARDAALGAVRILHHQNDADRTRDLRGGGICIVASREKKTDAPCRPPPSRQRYARERAPRLAGDAPASGKHAGVERRVWLVLHGDADKLVGHKA